MQGHGVGINSDGTIEPFAQDVSVSYVPGAVGQAMDHDAECGRSVSVT